ncbi:MAG: helix-turn-helix transcriptional regulator [Spirochaetota bacterium]
MSDIPKILFQKKENVELEFEAFTLESLFSRETEFKYGIEKNHRVDFHHIIYITKGKGKHCIDFIPYTYNPGSMFFISKGQVHAFEINPNNKGYIIIFTEEFLSKNLLHSDTMALYRLYNYHLYSPILEPEKIEKNRVSKLILEIYEEYQYNNDFAKEEILRLLLKLLLLKVERIKQTIEPKIKNAEWISIFNQFKTLVENNYTQTRNANDFAGMLYISYKHLNEVCKAITGNSAKKYIDTFVVLEIKRRLATSDLSINELSYKLGFDEATNLSKFFKKHTHKLPSQFKKILKKES